MVSAFPIDHVFHIQLFDNPDCGVFDGGLTDHCATFVKLPFSSIRNGYNRTTYKVFPFIFNENARQVYLETLSKELKMPNFYVDLDEHFDLFLQSIKNVFNYAIL